MADIARPRPRVSIDCSGPSRVKQSFKAETDINRIVERARKTGTLESFNGKAARYGDFSNVPDYHTALNTVKDARELFMALPADVRKRFRNDPAELLGFLSDEKNRKEAIELGLVPKPKEEVVKNGEQGAPVVEPSGGGSN